MRVLRAHAGRRPSARCRSAACSSCCAPLLPTCWTSSRGPQAEALGRRARAAAGRRPATGSPSARPRWACSAGRPRSSRWRSWSTTPTCSTAPSAEALAFAARRLVGRPGRRLRGAARPGAVAVRRTAATLPTLAVAGLAAVRGAARRAGRRRWSADSGGRLHRGHRRQPAGPARARRRRPTTCARLRARRPGAAARVLPAAFARRVGRLLGRRRGTALLLAAAAQPATWPPLRRACRRVRASTSATSRAAERPGWCGSADRRRRVPAPAGALRRLRRRPTRRAGAAAHRALADALRAATPPRRGPPRLAPGRGAVGPGRARGALLDAAAERGRTAAPTRWRLGATSGRRAHARRRAARPRAWRLPASRPGSPGHRPGVDAARPLPGRPRRGRRCGAGRELRGAVAARCGSLPRPGTSCSPARPRPPRPTPTARCSCSPTRSTPASTSATPRPRSRRPDAGRRSTGSSTADRGPPGRPGMAAGVAHVLGGHGDRGAELVAGGAGRAGRRRCRSDQLRAAAGWCSARCSCARPDRPRAARPRWCGTAAGPRRRSGTCRPAVPPSPATTRPPTAGPTPRPATPRRSAWPRRPGRPPTLALALAGLAWLQARRGDDGARAARAAEARASSARAPLGAPGSRGVGGVRARRPRAGAGRPEAAEQHYAGARSTLLAGLGRRRRRPLAGARAGRVLLGTGRQERGARARGGATSRRPRPRASRGRWPAPTARLG